MIKEKPEYENVYKRAVCTGNCSGSCAASDAGSSGKSEWYRKEAKSFRKISGEDYEAFKRGEIDIVKEQVLQGTKLGLAHNKIVKWIIEVAALDNHQIVQLSALIKNVVIANFSEKEYDKVFVKSSTGFYKTPEGVPNGATVPTIKLMLENSCPLPVKAAGGVRTYDEAVEMVQLGVKRIGTSAAKAIANGKISNSNY